MFPLGEAVGNYGEPVTVDLQFGGKSAAKAAFISSFASYDSTSNAIIVEGGKIDPRRVAPRYSFTVKVAYKDVFGVFRSF